MIIYTVGGIPYQFHPYLPILCKIPAGAPIPFKDHRYVDHGDINTPAHLEHWRNLSEKHWSMQSSEGYKNNNIMVTEIADNQHPHHFRGVTDHKGRLQSAALVQDKGDHFHISYVASAPHNMHEIGGGNHPHRVKGAGKALIRHIAAESAHRGYRGSVKLNAIPGSEGFYTKLGFTPTGQKNGSGHPEYELKPQAAKNLVMAHHRLEGTNSAKSNIPGGRHPGGLRSATR